MKEEVPWYTWLCDRLGWVFGMGYDPEYVRDFYDNYGKREWYRLESSPEAEVNFHLHQKYLLEYIREGDRVLEIGPGPGRFTLEMAALGARIVALEISPEQLRLNKEMVAAEGMGHAVEQWVEGDTVDLSRFPDQSFDAVVAYGGPLSYVFDQADQALGEMLRVVKAGGYVLLSVMSLLGTTRRFLDSIVELSFQHGLEAVDDITCGGDLMGPAARGHHCHMYRWSELRYMLEGHACDIVAVSASGFLAPQSEHALRIAHGSRELWDRLLEWEASYCQEPGAIDGGTHIISVIRRRETPATD